MAARAFNLPAGCTVHFKDRLFLTVSTNERHRHSIHQFMNTTSAVKIYQELDENKYDTSERYILYAELDRGNGP